MPDLVFELGTEEMPALEIPRLAEELKAEAKRALSATHLAYTELKVAHTPRRLVLFVKELAPAQVDRVEEIKGPPAAVAFDQAGSPTQAGIAFAESRGFTADSLEKRQIGDKAYAFVRQTVPGSPAVEILREILPRLIEGLHPNKRMRWDASGITFIRPIRWLVCLYGDDVVPVSLGTLCALRTTRGHRFIGQEKIILENAASYETILAKAFVTIDPKKRKKAVLDGLKQAATQLGGEYLLDEELLERIVNGAEHPVPVVGSIPAEFLDLPIEVIHATLREEGKFVPICFPDRASSYFVGFRDGLADEKGIVRCGFERVVRARLRDSRFFFEKDRKRPLAERVRELREMTYDVRLGSLWNKVERIRALAAEISVRSEIGAPAAIDRAAFLCKADLVTEMVKAFPSLQGVAGGIYARHDGEPSEVAAAIQEHYLPVFSGDELPKTDVAVVISLADKLDTVVGALLVGEQPSGSRDPYGIKRQANGLIRIAIEKEVDLDFFLLVGELQEIYTMMEKKAKFTAVMDFLADRADQLLRQRYGFPSDVVTCVKVAGMENFYRTLLRAQALTSWQKHPEFQALVVGFTRVRNITKFAQEKGFDPSLFKQEAERVLWREYLKAEGQISRLFEKGNYTAGFEHLLPLKEPIDRYFDEVLVMTDEEELRRNRLGFLNTLAKLFLRVGDFSTLVVENTPS